MKKLVVLFLLLSACSSQEFLDKSNRRNWQVYGQESYVSYNGYPRKADETYLDNWKIKHTDEKSVEFLCGKNISGCVLKTTEKIIICEKGNFESCGHALYHATHGPYHKIKE